MILILLLILYSGIQYICAIFVIDDHVKSTCGKNYNYGKLTAFL